MCTVLDLTRNFRNVLRGPIESGCGLMSEVLKFTLIKIKTISVTH